MRVLLPWRAANQPQDNNESSGEEESEEEFTEYSPSRSSGSESTDSEEPSNKHIAAEAATEFQEVDTEISSAPVDSFTSSKRQRLDSKPFAIDMTAGPLRSPSSDSDDEKLPAAAHWPPLENEPFDPFYSSNFIIRSNNEETDQYQSPAASRDDVPRRTQATHNFQPIQGDEVRAASPPPFDQSLKKRGLEIVEMAGDGNCLFRAVALQVYGDVEMHLDVRAAVCDFMEGDPEHFGPFVDEPLVDYIQRKRNDGVHGNNPEIQAMSELFNRPVEVFTPDNGADQPLNIFQKDYATQDQAIRLSYHDGNHYNAVVDPLKPTAGLGLGMPGLKIGLADQLQVSKAVAESDMASDQLELQRILEESTEDEVKRVMKETRMHTSCDEDDALQRALKASSYAMDYDYVSLNALLMPVSNQLSIVS
jgi:hypothetical protein